MKKSIIMSVVLSQFVYLSAQEVTGTMQLQVPITLEEKNLIKRQVMLKNKQHAWKMHKKRLIYSFKERHDGDTNLGKEDYYGKLRLQERQKDFYTSLKSKDDDIAKKLYIITKKLKALKKRYTRISTTSE